MSSGRLLVTGVAGFVGPYLARAAAAHGYSVHGLGLQPSPPEVRDLLADERLADLRDLGVMVEGVGAARPTAVIHLAGQSSVSASIERPTETFEANATGTWNLLEAVRTAAPAARVVIVGSGDVYGPQPEGSRVREDSALHPVSPYGLSKAMADSVAAFFGERLGLDVIRTRSFAHLGPGQTDRFVVPALARQIAEIELGLREPVMRVGNLAVTRDVSPVESVVEAYLALLARGRSGAVYNVCCGRGVKLSELADRMVGGARVPIRILADPERMRAADIPYLVGDPAAITRDTAWSPAIDLDPILDRILEDWRSRAAAGARSLEPGHPPAGER